MFPIEEATMAFVEEIRKTDIYSEYRNRLIAIKKEPELYNQVNEYRLRNFRLQTVEPVDGLLEKMDSLEREYESIMDRPLVSAFLRAELAFCRLMQDINKCITLELDFG